jgi:uncharacterized protein
MAISAIRTAAQPRDRERHSISQSLALHLLPGAAVALVFGLLAQPAAQLGLPAPLALLLAWPLAGIPIQLGTLLYLGWQRNGRLALDGIVLNLKPMALRSYAWLVPLLLAWSAAASTFLFPLSEKLRGLWFAWWPPALDLAGFAQNLSQYPPAVLWTVVLLSAVTNVVVPVIEEYYFRGYLLPRLPASATWAPLLSVVLFSLYHFWSPWENPARIITLLPLIYAVQATRNLRLSVAVHVLLNSLGTVLLVVLVFGAVRA